MRGDRVCRWICACALTIAATDVYSATKCTLSTTPVAFNSYNVFSTSNNDITGSVIVSCKPAGNYSVSLSTGGGSYAVRRMTNGPYILNYNLYSDATRTTIWGDGSAGTAIVSGNSGGATHTVYGRIPALQNAHTGNFSDTIIVTVTF